MVKKVAWCTTLIGALILQSCGTLPFRQDSSRDYRLQEEQYQPYRLQNTIAGYREFISRHPDSTFVADAQTQIAHLEFAPYQKANTIEGYMEFKARYPDNPHCAECDPTIEQLAGTAGEKHGDAEQVQPLPLQSPASASMHGTQIMTLAGTLNQAKDYIITTSWTLMKKGRTKHRMVYMEKRKYFGPAEDFFYKSVVRYIEPTDYYGTALLTWNYKDNQRLFWTLRFQRKSRKVKRDTNPDLLRPPAEADFSLAEYYDINVGEEIHHLLRSEMHEDTDCFVVKSTPLTTNLKYGSRISWIDKQHYTPRKIVYYDKKDVPWKALDIIWQKKHDLWFWKKAEATNLQEDYKTFITIDDLRVNLGLPDRDFTRNSLETKILGF